MAGLDPAAAFTAALELLEGQERSA